MWYHHLAPPMMALVCLHPLFLHVSALEKTIWVSCHLPGCDRRQEKTGERWDGRQDQRGRAALSGDAAIEESSWSHRCSWTHGCCSGPAKSCLPGASALISRLSRHWALLGHRLAGSGQVRQCHWPRGALQKIGTRGDVADLREKKSKGGFVSRT